jgi:glycosyltransferase involved in cell wall biosynthesis
MSETQEPLVSVLTPAYNMGRFLPECIESVLAQTYRNFEYIIVENCSTDNTPEIVARYAQCDKRIRVCRNEKLLDIISNHNRAFRLISPVAKYCKVVSADDWLFPECIARMVDLAEANPSIGIVGSYQLSGGGANWRAWRVRWDEIPYPSPVTSGREICRNYLLGGPYVFGTPTSILYRADLVRREESFYPNSTAEADTSACIKYLAGSDFGFVHQVLSYERIHHSQMSTVSKELHAYWLSKISDLREYGSLYFTDSELEARLRELMKQYYELLAACAVNLREKSFWAYHEKRLKEIGYPLRRGKLAKAICFKLIDLLLNPKQAVQKALKRNAR